MWVLGHCGKLRPLGSFSCRHSKLRVIRRGHPPFLTRLISGAVASWREISMRVENELGFE